MNLEQQILEQYPIRMRESALRTANTYARLARPMEVYMHLLGDSTIDEVVLNKEQVVDPSFCRPTARGLEETYKDIRAQGKKVVGWCHSHGEHPLFFSSYDHANVTPFAGMGGITREIDGREVDLFYNIVVNAHNDAPYGTIAYHADGGWGVIDPAPVEVIRESVSEEEARTQLESSLYLHKRVPTQTTSVPRCGEGKHQRLLSLLSRPPTTYRRIIAQERKKFYREHENYTIGFGTVLDALEGKNTWRWLDRTQAIALYYSKFTATEEESRAVGRILNAGKYVQRKHQQLVQLIQRLTKKGRARSQGGKDATGSSDSSLGKREAKAA